MQAKRIPLAAAAVAMTLPLMGQDDTGCSTETVDEPDEQPADDAGKKKAKANVAKIGDPITLEGTDTKMRVTVLKIIDPVAGGQFDEPTAGNRFVGVQVKLQNVGDTTYSDAPSNGAELIMSDDTQAEGGLLGEGQCSSDFGSSAKVSPGSVQQGCIPFQAKQGLRPKTFQFGLDSGFGPQSGEWRLR